MLFILYLYVHLICTNAAAACYVTSGKLREVAWFFLRLRELFETTGWPGQSGAVTCQRERREGLPSCWHRHQLTRHGLFE